MTKRILATGLLALMLVLAPATASKAAPLAVPRVPLVVLVLASNLTWDDVLSGYAPYTEHLAADGAVGDLNVRSLVLDAGRPSAANGALMLSAGAWTRYDPAGGTAVTTADGALVYPGVDRQARAQRSTGAGAVVGALGQSIMDAGGVTAAIGNAGPGSAGNAEQSSVLVAMDRRGRVPLGDLSSDLLRRGAGNAPMGVASDAGAIAAALSRAMGDPRVVRGPALIVVDPGDLERATFVSRGRFEGVERLDRVEAVKAFDDSLRAVHDGMPSGALLLVATQVAAEQASTPSGFGPVIFSGAGWQGLVVSPSTHRPGVMSNADLTATVMRALGITPPANIVGRPVSSGGVASDAHDRITYLQEIDAAARSVDAARRSVVDGFVLLALVLLLTSTALLGLRSAPRIALDGASMALLLVAAVPSAALLMFVPVRYPASPAAAIALLVAVSFAIWTLDVSTHHSRGLPRAMSVLAALTVVVILVDQWLGAPNSFSSFFGYSALVGARYYGLGNEGAALLVGAAVTGMAVILDHNARRWPWVREARRYVFPAVAAVCLLTATLPFLGANAGVAVWGTFAFGLVWTKMLGYKSSRRSWAVLMLIAALLVGTLGVVDILRSEESRTHVGRALLSAWDGGPASIVELATRKMETNLRLLTSTSWTWLMLGIVVVLGVLRVRPKGVMLDTLAEHPTFGAALGALLLAGMVAYLTEDSGIVVTALLALFPTVALVYLMLTRVSEGSRA